MNEFTYFPSSTHSSQKTSPHREQFNLQLIESAFIEHAHVFRDECQSKDISSSVSVIVKLTTFCSSGFVASSLEARICVIFYLKERIFNN